MKLNYKEYSEQAFATLSNIDHYSQGESGYFLNILHCTTGLVEESYEIINSEENNIEAELGDQCWYAICLTNLLNKTFSEINPESIEKAVLNYKSNKEYTVNNLDTLLADNMDISIMIANKIKKMIFYSKPTDQEVLFDLIGNIFLNINDICMNLEIDIYDVMENNIIKLQKRYKGKKFSADEANNRNTQEEESHFKK
jgi:NTP pyrophosphatase (non-canonical NTP hydrolase)